MRIENEVLMNLNREELSQELHFFFDNVMDTVVDFFKEEKEVAVEDHEKEEEAEAMEARERELLTKFWGRPFERSGGEAR